MACICEEKEQWSQWSACCHIGLNNKLIVKGSPLCPYLSVRLSGAHKALQIYSVCGAGKVRLGRSVSTTQAPERARVALEGLKMKPLLIDEYIAKFEDLCRKAGYTVGSSEVTYQFLKGLPKHILEDVVKGPQTGDFIELKQCAVQVTRSQELLNNILKQQNSNTTYIPRP